MTPRTPLKSIPRAITSVVIITQLSPFRIRTMASSRSFLVIPACRQSTFGTLFRTSCSARDEARACVDVKTMIGGVYGCDKNCNRDGSLEDSSATYVSFCEMEGRGVSLMMVKSTSSRAVCDTFTYFRPTTTRMGSLSIRIAMLSAPAGSVALKTAVRTFSCVQAATTSCV